MNRVQVVLSGFSMRLFCFVQAKTFCMYGCMEPMISYLIMWLTSGRASGHENSAPILFINTLEEGML